MRAWRTVAAMLATLGVFAVGVPVARAVVYHPDICGSCTPWVQTPVASGFGLQECSKYGAWLIEDGVYGLDYAEGATNAFYGTIGGSCSSPLSVAGNRLEGQATSYWIDTGGYPHACTTSGWLAGNGGTMITEFHVAAAASCGAHFYRGYYLNRYTLYSGVQSAVRQGWGVQSVYMG